MQADQIIERSAYASRPSSSPAAAARPRAGPARADLARRHPGQPGDAQVLTRTRMRRALAELVVEIADVGIWVVALFVAAAVAFPSVTPASMLTGLGLGSVAIGFAFRDIFENFLAGILILYREPFRLGDCIECARSRASSRRSRRGTRTCANRRPAGGPAQRDAVQEPGLGPDRPRDPPHHRSSAGSRSTPTSPPRARSSAARSRGSRRSARTARCRSSRTRSRRTGSSSRSRGGRARGRSTSAARATR